MIWAIRLHYSSLHASGHYEIESWMCPASLTGYRDDCISAPNIGACWLPVSNKSHRNQLHGEISCCQTCCATWQTLQESLAYWISKVTWYWKKKIQKIKKLNKTKIISIHIIMSAEQHKYLSYGNNITYYNYRRFTCWYCSTRWYRSWNA